MSHGSTGALAPQSFFFNSSQVRVIHAEDGPRWVAQDVCEVLGIANPADVLAKRLDEDEKGVASVYTLRGIQELLVVNEPGLYQLVLGSRKPEAKSFKRWLTHEVIPSIRQTGAYVVPSAQPQQMREVAGQVFAELIPEVIRQFQQGMAGFVQSTVEFSVKRATDPLMEHFRSSVRPKDPTQETQRRLIRFIADAIDCRCFSCLQVPVVSKEGRRLHNTEWSRWKGVHRRSISEVWLICADCGVLYRSNENARVLGDEKFRSFQQRRLEWEHVRGAELLQMELEMRAEAS